MTNKVTPTVILTSDYAAQEAAKITCRQIEREEKSCGLTSPVKKFRLIAQRSSCDACLSLFNSDRDRKFAATSDAYNEFLDLMGDLKAAFLEQYQPELYSELKKTVSAKEKYLTAEGQINFEVITSNKKSVAPEALDILSVSESDPRFLAWLKEMNVDYWDYLVLNSPIYRQLGKYVQNNFNSKNFNFEGLAEKIKSDYNNQQLLRKRNFNVKIKSCHLIATSPFTSNEIKERYEKIRQCEASPLN